MGLFSSWFKSNRVYGEPFRDKNGLWRIRIFQLNGLKRDSLFASSIEDTYPTREKAMEVLRLVKSMEIM